MRRHLTTDIISPHARPDQKSAQEDTMHPLILQQLAADRVAEMIARADGRRQERQARGARPARTSRRRAWPSPLRTQADPPAQ